MEPLIDDAPLAAWSQRRPSSSGTDARADRAENSPPGDWSALGRRVLAEALRRATDELETRAAGPARPVRPHRAQKGGNGSGSGAASGLHGPEALA
jgi:hypothetical protein